MNFMMENWPILGDFFGFQALSDVLYRIQAEPPRISRPFFCGFYMPKVQYPAVGIIIFPISQDLRLSIQSKILQIDFFILLRNVLDKTVVKFFQQDFHL